MQNLIEPTPDPTWVLTKHGYDPVREEIYEARFAISNGFLGVRAGRAISRGARWVEPHRTYVAGLFDIPSPQHPIPRLVAAPGWLQVRIVTNGGLLVYHPSEVSTHSMTLDMRRGV
jgi:trehalose/maltose hydrolase-like predicted phosphorylase